MLQIQERTPNRDGFYLTGIYTLSIVPIRNDVVDAANPIVSYTFNPGPSDIDTNMAFPNDVQPDQADGVYVSVNEVGTGTISIRGTTGQFPQRSELSKYLGSFGSAVSSAAAPVSRIIPGADAVLGNKDGYAIWMALYNFFAVWAREVRSNPYQRAMVFLNHKDVEFLQVVPMNFRKTRTSARPMGYGYSIDFQVLSTVRYTVQIPWWEFMASVRSNSENWKRSIDRAILLISQLGTQTATGFISAFMNPVQESISSMSARIQGLEFAGKVISDSASSSYEALKNPSSMAFGQEFQKAVRNRPNSAQEYNVPFLAEQYIIPPTRTAVMAAFDESGNILDSVNDAMTQAGSLGADSTQLALDDSVFEAAESALDLVFTGHLAADSAPLPEYSPSMDAASEAADMHRTSRLGGASLIEGRSDEFASALLAGDTEMLDGARTPRSTRSRGTAEHPLSYLAAKLLPGWVRGDGTGVPAELSSFRRAVLGMRDPTTMAPLFRAYTVKSTDTIYSIATDLLGMWSRWPEIALINGLTYPYISPQSGSYQAGPGDTIYVAAPDAEVPAELVESLLNIAKTHDLVSLQDLYLGIDWEVDALTGDFVWSEYDFAMVAGPKAFDQELAVVLEGSGGVTPDQVAVIPLKVGTKSRGTATVRLWQSLIANWLEQDPRIVFVEWVTVKQEGSVVTYSSKVKFRHYDDTVVLAGALRN